MTDGSVVLVHASGAVLCGSDGVALVFSSAAQAEEFGGRFLCEPAGYHCRAASAGASAPLSPAAA